MPPPPHRRRLFAIAAAVSVLAILAGGVWLGSRRQPVPFPAQVAGAPDAARARSLQAAARPAAPPRTTEIAAALEDFLAGRPFVLVENGQPRPFELALDELHVAEAPIAQRWQKVDAQPTVDALLKVAKAKGAAAGQGAGLVIYPQGQPRTKETRRALTARWLVACTDRLQAAEAVEKAGFQVVDEPAYAQDYLVIAARAGGALGSFQAAAKLQKEPGIAALTPMLLHSRAKKLVPNDAFFSSQWHLKNTGQGGGKVGIDIGATAVWNNVLGDGIRIGVVDDGIQMDHPDLVTNVDTDNDYDWNDFPKDHDASADPMNDDLHGTAVSGVIGARSDNGVGVSGVAPHAKLVGFRLIADDSTDDQMEAESVSRSNDLIQVKNNSWGYPDRVPEELGWSGPLMVSAMEAAAKTGRGSLGTISLWAAGNGRLYGDQGNKDAYANNIYGIAVGGVTNSGNLASYSEGGSHLTVVAPTSGGTRSIATTDFTGDYGYNNSVSVGELSDLSYTNDFGGTSAAAPVVSGVVALMLQTNPQLGWRDVKEILLRSSTKLAPTDPGWVSRNGGAPSSLAPIKHHEKYGGGMVNAQTATAMAAGWTNLGPMISQSRSGNFNPRLQIPDNSATGVSTTFDFSDVTSMRVEQVTVRVNISHAFRGDLQISLRSPSGAVSTLATTSIDDYGVNYPDWVFSSVRHWGEAARGTWTVICKDLASGDIGSLASATVTLYGSEAAPAIFTQEPTPLLIEEGQSATFTASITGYGEIIRQWKKNTAVISGATGDSFAIPSVKISDAATYYAVLTNLTGTATSAPVPLGVVNRQVPSQTVNEGATCTFKAVAAGPGIAIQWLHDGIELANDARISGAGTAVLTIKGVQPADFGSYTCRVTLGQLPPLETQAATLTVRVKPVVHAPLIENGVISGTVSYPFTADNGATRFAATGVPAGMTFNTTTGLLSGTPNAANTYTIKVTATNAAGTSAPVEVVWTVGKLPTAAQGTFNGLIDRNDVLNKGLGGRFILTVSATGMLTGSVTVAGKSHSLTGRLNAKPGNVNPRGSVVIKRTAPLSNLALEFTIDLPTHQVIGTLADANARPVPLSAWRNDWIVARNATDYAGNYNNAILLPEPGFDDPTLPHGTGYAILAVTTSGTATWTGKLADGTSLTGSSTIGPFGEVPLHAMLYASTGSIQGWSQIAGQNVDGTVDWFKASQSATSTARSFKAGIPRHSLTVFGARYLKPGVGEMLFGLTAGADNAQLRFIDGGLAPEFDQLFEITTTNTARMPAGTHLNPQQVRLTLTPTTGLFSGSFTLRNDDPRDVTLPIAVLSRLTPFNGLIVTRAGLNAGIGPFNLAELPDATGETVSNTPLWSGAVMLQAAPPPP